MLKPDPAPNPKRAKRLVMRNRAVQEISDAPLTAKTIAPSRRKMEHIIIAIVQNPAFYLKQLT